MFVMERVGVREACLFGPVPASDDQLADLVARGLADPPRPWGPLPEPLVCPPGPPLSRILDELREEREF